MLMLIRAHRTLLMLTYLLYQRALVILNPWSVAKGTKTFLE